MKYIIIGLGNFGASLAKKLTEQGNEVIGVDASLEKVELLKESISHTICLDATNQQIMAGLPWKDTDISIITIGEDQGANILATAIAKILNPNITISRAINPVHQTVLEAMGVTEILHPEEEAAVRWAKKLSLKGMIDSFELDRNYSIVEVKVPARYAGKTLEQIGFRRNHNVVVLSTIRTVTERTILGVTKTVQRVQGVASPHTVLLPDEVMVLYGSNKDLNALLEEA